MIHSKSLLSQRLRRICFWSSCAIPVGLLVVGTLAISGCQTRNPAARARQQLKQLNQEFTVDDFLRAARDGNTEALELFLRAGMDRNSQDSRGYSALMEASESGRTDAMKKLLEGNAKTDLTDTEGRTALSLAAGNDQSDAVRMLVEANADVTIRDTKNWTPLLKAIFSGYDRSVQTLLGTSKDRLASDGQLDRGLLVAAFLGNNEMIQALLNQGANVNARLDRGQTALMCAATAGKMDAVKLLLQSGAETSTTNDQGLTAAQIATQRGFTDLGKLIATSPVVKPAPPTEKVAASQAPAAESQSIAKNEAANAPSTTPSNNSASANPAAAPQQPASAESEKAAAPTADANTTGRESDGIAAQSHTTDKTPSDEKAQSSAVVAATEISDVDTDGDGFSDAEEIKAGTDPYDSNSHPGYHTKMKVTKITTESFPAIFEGAGADENTAKIRVGKGADAQDYLVAVNDTIPNMPYKVTSMRSRTVSAKDTAQRIDASELTLTNTENGEKTVLVRSMAAKSSTATRARIVLSLPGQAAQTMNVRVGEEIQVKADPTTHYQVIDIRPTQVVLRVAESNQTVTLGKEGR